MDHFAVVLPYICVLFFLSSCAYLNKQNTPPSACSSSSSSETTVSPTSCDSSVSYVSTDDSASCSGSTPEKATMARARHILVYSQEECLALIERIESGESFEDIARQYSQCPSSAKGGDLGTFGRGQMVPAFDVIVFSAPLNSIEGPVKTQFGYHIIEVTERS